MTLKSLFSISAILNMLLGLGWILFPKAVLGWWGTTAADDILVYVSQRYGALFLGYATIIWLSRDAPPSRARQALVIGGFVVSLLMAAMSLKGVLANTIAATGYISLTIEALLALGFAYFLFIRREPATG